ncbi:sulfatase-like hydrolase/transferase (plasmid) [Ensifer adhaerens]|uniref:sulfatase-like hydrolase/transferase n=1 Tax=Ensifer adhaerens TaxID=106592 RepID=UPI001CBB42F5|nr:sulfatase-like hydrolase/transferase [Ensifer adhaerens]UAX98216.1 sulfatase-like hydrolase/transferase [Ensifer adhaerens]UAY05598.1 sulfatase-like hydrolase/transferase [Ensifer adhaerens]UAY12976.1 sulfatase-like hydrolase/transferase [Ensifer adhaerens]
MPNGGNHRSVKRHDGQRAARTGRSDIMSYPNDTLRALACTNALTAEFVDRLERSGLMEDTVLVIQSDHLAMRNEIYSMLEGQSGATC